jgi:hypothetical protein
MSRWIALTSLLFITACRASGEPLPRGCYRTSEGRPILKLEGEHARLMIPGQVTWARIRRIHAWGRTTIEVSPSFHLGGNGTVLNPASVWRFEVGDEAAPPILLPIEPHGEVPIMLGEPCSDVDVFDAED